MLRRMPDDTQRIGAMAKPARHTDCKSDVRDFTRNFLRDR